MNKIVKISQIKKFCQSIHQQKQKIVLVGGCFDLVHLGHLIFLQKAKTKGNTLIVLLESDQTIRRLKGPNRPINSQINRAKFLTYLKPVDFIILLPEFKTNQQYRDLVNQLKPDIIAVTQGDQNLKLKTAIATFVNSKIIVVTKKVSQQSTSLIINKL